MTAQEQYKQSAMMPKIASGFDTTSKKLIPLAMPCFQQVLH
ncbi:hypothetical protein AAFF39_00070 [Lactococcus garvieae]